MFVDHCLSNLFFHFDQSIVGSSSIYGFLLFIWTFLAKGRQFLFLYEIQPATHVGKSRKKILLYTIKQ